MQFNFWPSPKNFNHAQNILGPEEGLVLCPFTGPKMFCAGPNILCQTKNRTVLSATSKYFVLTLKLNAKSRKNQKSLGQAQYVDQFLVWHITFGRAQNILGPEAEEGIGIKSRRRYYTKVQLTNALSFYRS